MATWAMVGMAALGAMQSAQQSRSAEGTARSTFGALMAPYGSDRTQKLLPRAFRTTKKGGILWPGIEGAMARAVEIMKDPGRFPEMSQYLKEMGIEQGMINEMINRSTEQNIQQVLAGRTRTGGSANFASALAAGLRMGGMRARADSLRSGFLKYRTEKRAAEREDIAQSHDWLNQMKDFLQIGKGGAATAATGITAASNARAAASSAGMASIVEAMRSLRPSTGGGTTYGSYSPTYRDESQLGKGEVLAFDLPGMR